MSIVLFFRQSICSWIVKAWDKLTLYPYKLVKWYIRPTSEPIGSPSSIYAYGGYSNLYIIFKYPFVPFCSLKICFCSSSNPYQSFLSPIPVFFLPNNWLISFRRVTLFFWTANPICVNPRKPSSNDKSWPKAWVKLHTPSSTIIASSLWFLKSLTISFSFSYGIRLSNFPGMTNVPFRIPTFFVFKSSTVPYKSLPSILLLSLNKYSFKSAIIEYLIVFPSHWGWINSA